MTIDQTPTFGDSTVFCPYLQQKPSQPGGAAIEVTVDMDFTCPRFTGPDYLWQNVRTDQKVPEPPEGESELILRTEEPPLREGQELLSEDEEPLEGLEGNWKLSDPEPLMTCIPGQRGCRQNG